MLNHAAFKEAAQRGTASRELIIARAGSKSAPRASVDMSLDVPYVAASKISSGTFAIRKTIGAGAGSLCTQADLDHSSPDASYIAPLSWLHASMKDESFASLTRTVVGCIRKADGAYSSNDIESIKP